METVLLDQVVMTDYGQFDLTWDEDYYGFDGDFDRIFEGQVNGLAGAAKPEGLYLNLARRSGGSAIRITLRDTEPDDLDDAEDVVEVSIAIPDQSRPRWSTWAGENGGPCDLPSGSYRVRVSARGRDAGHADEFADGVVDSYVIECWPAAAMADAIIRVTSANAEYWHREIGSRR